MRFVGEQKASKGGITEKVFGLVKSIRERNASRVLDNFVYAAAKATQSKVSMKVVRESMVWRRKEKGCEVNGRRCLWLLILGHGGARPR